MMPSTPLTTGSRIHSTKAATLSSLPQELVTLIALHCSTTSDALSLALTSRSFVAPSEKRLWRNLALVLNPHFGEQPLISPFSKKGTDPAKSGWEGSKEYREWAKAESLRADMRHRMGLKVVMKELLLFAGERRMGMVKGLRIEPQPGSLYGLTQVLDSVSPHLQMLNITHDHYLHDYWDGEENPPPLPHETLDCKFIDAGLHFPSLTYVRVGPSSIQYSDFILLLCLSAPNLTTLLVDYQRYLPSEKTPFDFPRDLPGGTRIERMCLSFSSPDEPQDYDEYKVDTTAFPLLVILESSPLLRQLSISYCGCAESTLFPIAHTLAKDGNLADFYWPTNTDAFEAFTTEDEPVSHVRRLALRPYIWSEIFRIPRGFPKLDIFTLVRSAFERESFLASYPEPYFPRKSVYLMIPSFANALRGSPDLAAIYTIQQIKGDHDINVFDEVDKRQARGDPTGRIRSFRHGDSELVHASLWLGHVESSDEACKEREYSFEWDAPSFTYTARDGTIRRKTFDKLPKHSWHEFTDYEGHAIPLSVITEMRQVEGASEAEWQGRGIDVGDEAWRVLTDWKEEKEGMKGKKRSGRKSKKDD